MYYLVTFKNTNKPIIAQLGPNDHTYRIIGSSQLFFTSSFETIEPLLTIEEKDFIKDCIHDIDLQWGFEPKQKQLEINITNKINNF